MTYNNIIYLLCNVLRTFTIFKFMCVFFNRDDVNHVKETISFFVSYIVVAVLYLIFDNPLLNVIINVMSIFAITFNYNTKHKKRVCAILNTYAMLILIEFSVVWGMQVFSFTQKLTEDIQLIVMQILTSIITYAVALIFANFKAVRNSEEVTAIKWIATIVIPLITIILAISPLLMEIEMGLPLLILIIATMFLVNIIVFYLYDELLKSLRLKMENALVLQQNNAYEGQLNILYYSQDNIALFRHDVKNHLHTLQKIISDNKTVEAIEYIGNTFDAINNEKEFCKSQNYVIDSILNFKISQGIKMGVNISTSLNIPNKMHFQAFDLNAILGNLMDNAINGAVLSSEKIIKIDLKYECEVLIIEIVNSFNGIVKMKNHKFVSTNTNAYEHGLGVTSVERAVTKYNGELVFDYDKTHFTAKVIIFDYGMQKAKTDEKS